MKTEGSECSSLALKMSWMNCLLAEAVCSAHLCSFMSNKESAEITLQCLVDFLLAISSCPLSFINLTTPSPLLIMCKLNPWTRSIVTIRWISSRILEHNVDYHFHSCDQCSLCGRSRWRRKQQDLSVRHIKVSSAMCESEASLWEC
ncbi:hypothetical protein INR49_008646 [Caranx melampygus]|nr:hypothetical protein INR49_008646 [Caranx melampygus]